MTLNNPIESRGQYKQDGIMLFWMKADNTAVPLCGTTDHAFMTVYRNLVPERPSKHPLFKGVEYRHNRRSSSLLLCEYDVDIESPAPIHCCIDNINIIRRVIEFCTFEKLQKSEVCDDVIRALEECTPIYGAMTIAQVEVVFSKDWKGANYKPIDDAWIHKHYISNIGIKTPDDEVLRKVALELQTCGSAIEENKAPKQQQAAQQAAQQEQDKDWDGVNWPDASVIMENTSWGGLREFVMSNPEVKICSVCSSELNLSDFYVKDPATGVLFPYCKDCHKIRMQKWREDNPEKAETRARIDNMRQKLRSIGAY